MRLDERRIGEILAGIDSASMGPAFVSTAGRLLGHLGDVMTLGFTPALVAHPAAAADPAAPPSQYLFQFESSDISRLRADVQSLGFVSLIRWGGAGGAGAGQAAAKLRSRHMLHASSMW